MSAPSPGAATGRRAKPWRTSGADDQHAIGSRPARRRPGARLQHRLRRAHHGDAARRLRRGRPQDRAADRGPGAHPRVVGAGPARDPARPVVEGDRPQQGGDDAGRPHARGPRDHAEAGRRRRRDDRELPARRAGGLGPGPGRAARGEPAAGAVAHHGLRAGRALRAAARVRLARRGDDRVRAPDRAAGRAADAAAVRARRRRRGGDRGVRGDDRAARPRPRRRSGPGDRPVAVRAAAGPHGPDAQRARPARCRARAAGQPLAQQRAPQHLPDP